jgi:DNA-binding MarR family transcriptional regulator
LPEPSKRELDPSTAGLLRDAYYELSRGIGGAVVGAGFVDLRPAHGNVLERLGHQDGLRVSQLAEQTSMTAQSMGELVDDLEAEGYVERRPDPADRRTKPVYLTTRGQAAIAASFVAVTAQEKEIELRLGAAGYEALREMLGSLGDFGIDPSTWREPPTADRD